MTTLTLTRPIDAHLHLRDGETLEAVIADSARQFARALVMPNLTPPVTTLAEAKAYRGRILDARDRRCPGNGFEPMMALYLTDQTRPEDIHEAAESGIVSAVKLYPSGATTNSSRGVTDIEKRYPIFEAMSTAKIPLSIHGEVVDEKVDIFDREEVFLDRTLEPLLERFPDLKVVLEHVTTRSAVNFVNRSGSNLAATITAHHLLINRNALLARGIQPHHYCLPIVKREDDRQALLEAATSGVERFFLGTDSAPHPLSTKESARGCAGIYTAFAAMSFYAEAFESVGCLDRLDDFASTFAARFYGWPQSADKITLTREPWTVDDTLPYDAARPLVPFFAGNPLNWRLNSTE